MPKPQPITRPPVEQVTPGSEQASPGSEPVATTKEQQVATATDSGDISDLFSEEKKEAPVDEELIVVSQDIKDLQTKDVTVDTDLFTAVFTNRGAGLKSFILKKYKDDKKQPLDLVSRKVDKHKLYPFYFSTFSGDKTFKVINDQNFLCEGRATVTLTGKETQTITFKYAEAAKGLQVFKSFTFNGDSYVVETDFKVVKDGKVLPQVPVMFGPDLENNILKDRMGTELQLAAFDGNKLHTQTFNKIKTHPSPNNPAFEIARSAMEGVYYWAAYERSYFAVILKSGDRNAPVEYSIIKEKKPASAAKEEKDNKDELYSYMIVSNPQQVYMGPKDEQILAEVEHIFIEANQVIEYGWLGSIAKLMLKGINMVYKFVPNYGWALVIFTLLLKILLFPLTYTSSVSMAKMQTLQPKIKAIKKKYKNMKDPEQRRQMQMETMTLYKKEKVNPMGGCLPMLLQMPILFGVFNLLRTSINVRHEPWILWIQDLSLKDPIYLLPILMGVSQIIVQKMSPSSGDSTQKKMMYIMPVVITIFVMSLPSGLTLYWFVSNLLQIGQQHIINKKVFDKKKEEDKQKKLQKRKKGKGNN